MRRDPNYFGDVCYEVWRSGGNPDSVDYDRVRDREYDGYDYIDSARAELSYQRRYEESEQIQEEEQPREWPDEVPEDEKG